MYYVAEFHAIKVLVMIQAVTGRPVTAETRVRYQLCPCEICGVQSGTGTGCFPSTTVFLCQYHSTNATRTRSTPRKEPSVPIEWESGWAPERIWTL